MQKEKEEKEKRGRKKKETLSGLAVHRHGLIPYATTQKGKNIAEQNNNFHFFKRISKSMSRKNSQDSDKIYIFSSPLRVLPKNLPVLSIVFPLNRLCDTDIQPAFECLGDGGGLFLILYDITVR